MVELKCPKCRSAVEIEDDKEEGEIRIGVFCKNEKCSFHKNPLIGLERKTSRVFLSGSIV